MIGDYSNVLFSGCVAASILTDLEPDYLYDIALGVERCPEYIAEIIIDGLGLEDGEAAADIWFNRRRVKERRKILERLAE